MWIDLLCGLVLFVVLVAVVLGCSKSSFTELMYAMPMWCTWMFGR